MKAQGDRKRGPGTSGLTPIQLLFPLHPCPGDDLPGLAPQVSPPG